MAKIQELDQNTIDQIAAGEVVERPSSVVKELVENAIDSGASSITVEIHDGGTSMIRITDNGSGIEKDQIRKAFKRHATSKLMSIDDIYSLKSLGFRGEALSSISAVAKVELITKTADGTFDSKAITVKRQNYVDGNVYYKLFPEEGVSILSCEAINSRVETNTAGGELEIYDYVLCPEGNAAEIALEITVSR